MWQKQYNAQDRNRNAKVGSQENNSGITWNNRQVWPWSTKWSREKLIEFCQENTLITANILLHNTRDDSTQTAPDDQYRNQIDYTLSSKSHGISPQSHTRVTLHLIWLTAVCPQPWRYFRTHPTDWRSSLPGGGQRTTCKDPRLTALLQVIITLCETC